MKKSFISILGTNDYLECRHSYSGNVSNPPVKYCQEDLIKFFCKNFDDDSEIRIFLTEDAERKNWLDNGHLDEDKNPIPNKGLKSRIEELNLNAKIIPIPIKEGFNETEIWENFQIIFESFREDEEVVVDITHSFRTLPMLLITLLNFAKQIKQIKVRGIYYAAFESLGTIQQAKNIPVEQRIVPILNLTQFSELQDWTNATYDFINNGSIKSLKRTARIYDKKNLTNKLNSEIIEEIDKILVDMAICRGNSIRNYDFNLLKSRILSLKSTEGIIKPLYTLLDKLSEKFNEFTGSDIQNLLDAVKWCFEHNLYQQAITILQETIINLILLKLGYEDKNRQNRLVVSSSFYIKKNKLEEKDWAGACTNNMDLTKKVLSLKFLNEIADDFDYLSEIRNDINHAGFTNNAKKSDSIIARLKNSIDNLTPKIQSFLQEDQIYAD